ncbi:ribonuclease VapC [Spirochaetia bacterium]|nr:ribonuclease VapC [Spirochaetia bacterium]
MLDTDTCSYIIKENPQSIVDKFWEHKDDDICISVITYCELLYGAMHKNANVLLEKINVFTSKIRIADFPSSAAEDYADIRNTLEKQGMTIGNLDILIASHARNIGAIIVTNNERHFLVVPELIVENWSK